MQFLFFFLLVLLCVFLCAIFDQFNLFLLVVFGFFGGIFIPFLGSIFWLFCMRWWGYFGGFLALF
jgi:hypothetical protein